MEHRWVRVAEAVVRSTVDDVPCSPTLHGRFLFTLLIVGAEYERDLVCGVHPRRTGQSIRLIQERRDAPKIPIRTRPFLGEAQT